MSPIEGETARRMISAERDSWRKAAERTSMPIGRDRGMCVLVTSRQPAASWMAAMLSTAAWLVGSRVQPNCGRRRAVQVDEAKARKTSRYARARQERALLAVRPEATG